jgi:TonB family protein
MKHNDKAWQDDNSARLDALLSDFLDRDIVAPPDSQSFSHPTSVPLGDLFPEIGSATETTSPVTSAQAAATAQKVTPVNRTEVWEATNRTGRLPQSQSSALENLAADRLEVNVNSVLDTSQAASRGKKFFFGSIAVILVLAAGLLIRQSRKTGISQQLSDEPAVTVSPSELDGPISTQAPPGAGSVPEPHYGTSETHTANSSNNGSPEGRSTVPVSVPDSSATASKPSTMNGVSASIVSNAAKLQKMPAPTLGRSSLTLGTIQDLPFLHPAEIAAPLPPPPAPPANTVKNVVPHSTQFTTATPAVPLTKVRPVYPELARRMNLAGTVHVALVVDTTGKVISAKAVDGSPVLRGSAELAVKQWRFKPATMNGKPVTGSGTVAVTFNPDRR